MAKSTHIVVLLVLLGLSPPGTFGQDGALPVRSPSTVETFSELPSFPATCANSGFLDADGKLWIITCESTRIITGIHHYQFDGYSFEVDKSDLHFLPRLTRYFGVTGGRWLIGSTGEQNAPQEFLRYDLFERSVDLIGLPEHEAAYSPRVTHDQRIVQLLDAGSTWQVNEFVGDSFTLLHAFTEPIPNGSRLVLYYDAATIWVLNTRDLSLARVRLGAEVPRITVFSNTELTAAPPPESLTQGGRPYERRIHFNPVKDVFYYYVIAQPRGALQIGSTDDQFEPWEIPDPDWTVSGISTDSLGNDMFLFKGNDGHHAVLDDLTGNRLDYSPCFTHRATSEITQVGGRDFRDQIFVFGSTGFSLVSMPAADEIRHFLPGRAIRAMSEFREQVYLVTTQSDGWFIVDAASGSVTPYTLEACGIPAGAGLNMLTCIRRDVEGHLWVETEAAFHRINPATMTCESYAFDAGIILMFEFIDDERIAVIDNLRQLYLYHVTTQTATPVIVDGRHLAFGGHVQEMIMIADSMWIATTQGLWKLPLTDPISAVQVSAGAGFTDTRFLCMHHGADGRLWMGTSTDGVQIFDPVTGSVEILNHGGGLSNNTVASIMADDEGYLWVGTYHGISLVSPEGTLVTNIYPEDGLVHNESNRHAFYRAKDGKLLIGTLGGLNLIDPAQLKDRLLHSSTPNLFLTALAHGGAADMSPAQISLHGQVIHLPAESRYLDVRFAISHFVRPDKHSYRYRLESIDTDWKPLGNQHQLSLNELPAGRYNLLIDGVSSSGARVHSPLVIPIHAREFFYKQWWFYALCLLPFLILAYVWNRRLRLEKERLQVAVAQATREIRRDKALIEEQAEQLRELDRAKSEFFTNISHEFRTPLTIISGMIDQVRDQPGKWLEKGTAMIKENAHNLLSLVNQILDLRKLESKTMQLDLIQGDVVSFLNYICASHRPYAQSRDLEIHFVPNIRALTMDYDPDKLLRIMVNLLSNAIKHTGSGGQIYVGVQQRGDTENEWLEVSVRDNGVGIAPDELELIFDRFYQGTTEGSGTGIGLALVKELVHLMGGSIDVQSVEGQGTTFTVGLPVTRKAEVHEVSSDGGIDTLLSPQVARVAADNEPATGVADQRILIVDDNPDIVTFLRACLESEYHLLIAEDGQAGVDAALTEVPDLVISDVMMPVKDGFTLCRELKQDIRTNHIPVILLTAKADLPSRLEGLQTGADDFLAKPFERQELLARIANLMETRRKLQERYASLHPISKPERAEDTFIQRVREAIEENLDDETYGILQLCRSLGMSRSQLHNKLKAITGQSTSIFIRNIRLHHARALLTDSEMNISEVAYAVGFKDPQYFSRLFAERYGMPPSKTRN